MRLRPARLPELRGNTSNAGTHTRVLVITTDGFPLAYGVMKDNTSDRTTPRKFLTLLENTFGRARRVW